MFCHKFLLFNDFKSRCSPVLGLVIYLWFVVYAAYQVISKFRVISPRLSQLVLNNLCPQIVKKADTARRGAQVIIVRILSSVVVTYIWVSIIFKRIMPCPDQMGPGTGGSESQSSISSLKEGLHRVIGGSPPPPYEVSNEHGHQVVLLHQKEL